MIPDNTEGNLIDNWVWRLLLRAAHCLPRRFLAACLVAAWDFETRDDVWFEDMNVRDLLNRLVQEEDNQ